MKPEFSPIFIYGPTAVGKTALAIRLAQETGGVIINADSMQLYHDLWMLSARPSRDELAQAEHWGFGIIDASVRWSTKAWLDHAHKLLEQARFQGRLPIFVGGTGLYHQALTKGLSDIPEPSVQIVEECKALSTEELAAQLAELDPASAHLADRQRMIRALAVSRISELPFSHWVAQPLVGGVPGVRTFVLDPDRPKLRQRIDRRFELMMEQGALEEVERLVAKGLDDDLPCLRAIGVPELSKLISGEYSRDFAIERAQSASRQYAKRQLTWARNQMPKAIKLPISDYSRQEMESSLVKIFSFLDDFAG